MRNLIKFAWPVDSSFCLRYCPISKGMGNKIVALLTPEKKKKLLLPKQLDNVYYLMKYHTRALLSLVPRLKIAAVGGLHHHFAKSGYESISDRE